MVLNNRLGDVLLSETDKKIDLELLNPNKRHSEESSGFALLCFGGFCFAVAYGMTFLLPLMMASRGANDILAGNIISTATISSIGAVIFSGHLSDHLGTCRAAMAAGAILLFSVLGFALFRGTSIITLGFGFVLGMGWGGFYTLGPILSARIVPIEQRTHGFAILAGCMMAGIGTGPIIGHIVSALDLPIESAFLASSVVVGLGILSLFALVQKIKVGPTETERSDRISWSAARAVMCSQARSPILMVCIAGAVFGGLSSFQTSLAAGQNVEYYFYFLSFTFSAIFARLFLSACAILIPPRIVNLALTALMSISIGLFINIDGNTGLYLMAAGLFGLSYGLLYSLLTGQAANEAPESYVSQALLLFSLFYFLGAFGMPIIAGRIVTNFGIEAFLYTLCLIASANFLYSLAQFRSKM